MTAQPVAALPFPVAREAAAYLRARLAGRAEPYTEGVYVGSTVPGTRRARSVVFRRDGGPIRGTLDYPRLNVRVFADDPGEGEDLADLVVALLLDWPNTPGPVAAVAHLSGPYGVPDATQSLHMALVEVTAHTTVL